MAKIDITKTELVWPGKYNEDGTLKEVPCVSLPFQVIETVNESRATREAKKGGVQQSLFDVWEGKEGDTFEAGWRNKLIWGDNLLVMGSLLEKFAGKIDLIYIDPPFATGADFSFTTNVGESGEELTKEQSAIEEKAYRDMWGSNRSSWFPMMAARLRLARELLSPQGTLYLHLDWYVGHHARPVLDEIFGEENSLGEVIWAYGSPSGGRVSGAKLVKAHDMIFAYAREYGKHKYKVMYLPYSDKYVNDWFKFTDENGRRFRKRWRRDAEGQSVAEVQYLDESKGVPASTVWSDIQQAYADPRAYKEGVTSEITGYPTQKPEKLLERVIEVSSDQGDLVADFFCGSGTTLAVAEKLGRRWIGCDLGRWGIHVTRKRLLGIENCKPFEVLNLGKYERQYWQGVTFGEAKDKPLAEQALYEYLAFILKLYGAQPVAGMAHLHGKKSKAMIHIGAVDAPVTIAEIDAAVDECAKLKQGELHVLGWEWEMGLYDLMVEAAKKKGVKLLLLQIPREVMEQQAAAKGDVRFFELAYLEAEIKQPKKLTAQVALKDFVIPNTDLIPEDVRSKVKKWSDYIDYWAVDWDFRSDTFMQGWVAYRTRKERKLPLASDPHTYEKPGKYRILVKVIDIFGNDTSQAFDVEVK
jgi:adenine-specific DNA-methyltransferase